MAQDAPKRWFLSLTFLVSCISKSFLIRVVVKEWKNSVVFDLALSPGVNN